MSGGGEGFRLALFPEESRRCCSFNDQTLQIMNKVSCIIMDWAGTAVDFGCFAPLNVFLSVFREKGLDITYRQAREPMGLLKVDHIRAILEMNPTCRSFTPGLKRTCSPP